MAKTPKTPKVATLPTTFSSMLDRAIATLKTVHAHTGVDFVVYSSEYNIKEGTIDLKKTSVKPKRGGRVRSKLPLGTLINYYTPFIQDMQPDELTQIPVLDFNIESLQASVISKAGSMWGRGTVTCVQSKDKTMLEVWRLPEGMTRTSFLTATSSGKRRQAEEAVDD
jgi:hypothetical protein